MSEPSWTPLYRHAAHQSALFTTADAAAYGISPQLLHHHRRAGRIERVRRSIYRVVHLPHAEDEQLVELWLWSGREGLFSHDTALAMHGLSDALPASVHLTVPESWRRRRLRVPDELVLHYGAAEPEAWSGPVPLTSAARTVRECRTDGMEPDLVEQAIHEGLERGLFAEDEVR